MEQSDPRHLLVAVARLLDRQGIPYAVTGGIAVLVWGRPRFTADIDIVVALKREHVAILAQALRQLSVAGYVDEAAMRDALMTSGEFNFIDGDSGMKVDFWIPGETTFERSRLARRVARQILGQSVYFVSAEDLILSKLQWHQLSGSARQLEDVASVLKISGDRLDRSYLNQWAEQLGVKGLLDEVRHDAEQGAEGGER